MAHIASRGYRNSVDRLHVARFNAAVPADDKSLGWHNMIRGQDVYMYRSDKPGLYLLPTDQEIAKEDGFSSSVIP